MSKNNTYWVGMDVHADTIRVAIYRGSETEPYSEYDSLTDTRSRVRLLKKLQELPGDVRCVYEAGPCGYDLHRYLTKNGISCEIAAPALIPKRAGNHIKTDKRDARNLGRLYRAGELTVIYVPEKEQESVRDLIRAREDAVEDVTRKKHQLSKYLLRYGYRYHDGEQWTRKHMNWMKGIHFETALLNTVFEEYLIALDQAEERVVRLTRAIEEISKLPEHQRMVSALMILRGVQVISAMTILYETGDFRRFARAKDFMSALGLVPSEYSSGSKVSRGSITKTGNSHVRRVLVESAWHYRHKPTVGPGIKARRTGQPQELLRIAQKADFRLNRKYRRLIDRGKRSTVAAVATARELAGFVWAIGQQIQQ